MASALRLEFAGQDHPVGREIDRVGETLVKRCVRLINAGRREGTIPPGPPARAVALAFVGALEGAVIALAGQTPHDELLAARAAAGALGLDGVPDFDTKGQPMKLPDTAHTSRPWRIHELTRDFGSRTSGRCRRRAARTTFPG